MHPHAPDHSSCPKFILIERPDGNMYMTACWDQTNPKEIAQVLRRVADGMDKVPEDNDGTGIVVI